MTGKAKILFSSEPGKILECLKHPYPDEKEAQDAATEARARSGHSIGAYPCQFPNHEGKWHIGHSRRGKAVKKKHRRRR